MKEIEELLEQLKDIPTLQELTQMVEDFKNKFGE